MLENEKQLANISLVFMKAAMVRINSSTAIQERYARELMEASAEREIMRVLRERAKESPDSDEEVRNFYHQVVSVADKIADILIKVEQSSQGRQRTTLLIKNMTDEAQYAISENFRELHAENMAKITAPNPRF